MISFTAHGSGIRSNKMYRDHILLNSQNESMGNPKNSPFLVVMVHEI